MLDPSALRQHFPSLTRQQEGRPVLYFDNPAGTQVPRETIDGFVRYLEQSNANVGGAFDQRENRPGGGGHSTGHGRFSGGGLSG